MIAADHRVVDALYVVVAITFNQLDSRVSGRIPPGSNPYA